MTRIREEEDWAKDNVDVLFDIACRSIRSISYCYNRDKCTQVTALRAVGDWSLLHPHTRCNSQPDTCTLFHQSAVLWTVHWPHPAMTVERVIISIVTCSNFDSWYWRLTYRCIHEYDFIHLTSVYWSGLNFLWFNWILSGSGWIILSI